MHQLVGRLGVGQAREPLEQAAGPEAGSGGGDDALASPQAQRGARRGRQLDPQGQTARGRVPALSGLALRAVVMVVGVGLNGVATGAYIGAGLGPGPRDNLMTGLAARGHSLRVARTSNELTALVVGWALGGSVGVGTVVYALIIGPLAHLLIPRLTVRAPAIAPEAAAVP